jgi:hypothetical protein
MKKQKRIIVLDKGVDKKIILNSGCCPTSVTKITEG